MTDHYEAAETLLDDAANGFLQDAPIDVAIAHAHALLALIDTMRPEPISIPAPASTTNPFADAIEARADIAAQQRDEVMGAYNRLLDEHRSLAKQRDTLRQELDAAKDARREAERERDGFERLFNHKCRQNVQLDTLLKRVADLSARWSDDRLRQIHEVAMSYRTDEPAEPEHRPGDAA